MKEQTELTTMQNVQYSAPGNHHVCAICGNAFGKASGLKRHMRVHTNRVVQYQTPNTPANTVQTVYPCLICNLHFNHYKDFEQHAQMVHSQAQALKCSICGCFRPITENTDARPFKCESCIHSLSLQNGLSMPPPPPQIVVPPPPPPSSVQIHHVIPTYNMVDQKALCTDESLLKFRFVRNKAESPKPVQYTSAATQARNKMKPYRCVECDKGYSHSSTLTMHKKLHTGDYKYICEYCDKRFFLNEYYTRHMRVHTKEKPYKCEVCDKSFSQSNTLTQHKRIHTGEKPYSCEDCGRMFSVRDYLNKHRRTHTGEKPFVCHVCDKKYSQSSGLKTHQKQHLHFRMA